MKHDAFDEALRRRAQREKSALSTQAEERVARAIREGQARAASHARAQGERDKAAFVWPGEEWQAPHKPRRRITRLIPLITGAAACLTAMVLWAARTPVDRVHESATDTGLSTHNAAFETVLPLADGTDGASALAPQAGAAALPERGVWRAEARFFNDTQDIWLVSWSVDTASEMLEPPDELIWLEPGASCVDQAAWPVEGEQEQPVWRYTAYRVTADVLHWMDGDWLRPGEDGYAAQQALITDAYENGALVLAPGNWENGMAGPMALVLPDALGNVSALETYLAAGLIVQESGGAGQMGESLAQITARLTATPAADKAAGAASTGPFTPALQAACELTATPFSGAAPMPVRMPGVTSTATACPEELA